MALLICLDCTAAYAVGVPLCPQCGSERSEEQGSDPYRGGTMPKINAAGEATFAADLDTEGGEEPSPQTQGAPGGSSETSTEKPPTSPETSSTGHPKGARGTGSRSKRTAAGNSSAGSTATGGPETAAAEQD